MSALQLPSLTVTAKAELITNNLPAFEESFRKGLDGLKYELLTDDDFAKAKDDIKAIKEAERMIASVDQEIVNGSVDIKAIRDSLAELAEEARQFRLDREKEIKERDAKIKAKILEDALGLIDHPKRERYRDQVAAGARGKRSFETMAKGANQAAKAVNEAILKTRAVLDEFENTHGRLLIPDRVDLELESVEVVGGKLNARLEKQRDEEEKARLKAEAEEARKQAEYEKAKATAEEAKTELKEPAPAPVTTPTPPTAPEPAPKVGTIPVGTAAKEAAQTAEEEMARFLAIVEVAFAPVKAARAKLRHTENIRRAQRFATALGEAWTEFKKGGSQ